MDNPSMTALVSLFARAYHSENCFAKVFDDSVAGQLLSQQEYGAIAENMTKGISYFNPGFDGDEKEALRWVVNNRLAPSPLGRSAFCEDALRTAVRMGASQYFIFASGYDTFAYRRPEWAKELWVCEIDREEMIDDKQKRLEAAGIDIPGQTCFVRADLTDESQLSRITASRSYDSYAISVCSLLGLSYYLTSAQLENLIRHISSLVPRHSTLIFDYPNEKCLGDCADEGSKARSELAKAAGEEMKGGFGYSEIERMLSRNGFLIYEHLEPSQINDRFFSLYNTANPDSPMLAAPDVNYCLAVKHR